MRLLHRPHKNRTLPVLVLFTFALATALLGASFLTSATPPQVTTGDPGQGPSPEPHTANGFDTARHEGPTSPYTAAGLLGARWDIGAVQANWNHRALWQSPVTGDGVRVAVIDTGLDAGHPDLAGSIVAWRDFVGGNDIPYDDTGHGTHVAGIITAAGHPQLRPDEAYFLTGARGIAPDTKIIAAKAMDENGRGDPNRIAEAILWSLEQDAHVINLSLGINLGDRNDPEDPRITGALRSSGSSSGMQQVEQAIRLAVEAGVVVVVAAGNHEPGQEGSILFPGSMDEVITVGATDPSGQIARFSNTGTPGTSKPDLVAPGIVVSTTPRTDDDPVARYRGLGGTSMAAPFVTGTIALMMEADPTLKTQTPGQDNSHNTERVRAILQETAQPLAGATADEQGAGLLRVDQALQMTGTGEAGLRPAAYATPLLVVVGGYWVARRRRDPPTLTPPPRRSLPPDSQGQAPWDLAHARLWAGPHGPGVPESHPHTGPRSRRGAAPPTPQRPLFIQPQPAQAVHTQDSRPCGAPASGGHPNRRRPAEPLLASDVVHATPSGRSDPAAPPDLRYPTDRAVDRHPPTTRPTQSWRLKRQGTTHGPGRGRSHVRSGPHRPHDDNGRRWQRLPWD